MNDLISKKNLIKSIDYIGTPGGIWAKPFEAYKEAFKEFVKGMPPAEPKWTPVAKRNPEEYDAYFITYESESWGGPKLPLITKIGTYNPYNRACPWLEDTGGVIAWMPLPEPYRPEVSE